MKGSVLLFYPHNPFPPLHGSHRRCLEMVQGLSALGFDIVFASSSLYSDTRWPENPAELARTAGLPIRFAFYHPTILDRYWKHFWSHLGRLRRQGQPWVSSPLFAPPRMQRWFAALIRREPLQAILINYVYWDRLLAHTRLAGTRRIMENHDLVSVNVPLQQRLHDVLYLPLVKTGREEDSVLDPNYFSHHPAVVASEELAVYDRYTDTICISDEEARIVRAHTRNTRIHYIPMTFAIPAGSPGYEGEAVTALGPNLFNLQGYRLFVRRILPHLLAAEPSFKLKVAGTFYRNYLPKAQAGVTLAGFVGDLSKVLFNARFALNPTFGGTGQQIKTIEAMAHGLPVVAWEEAARNSPLRHGINGLVARTAEEFIAHCLSLWRDRELCRRLGNEARQTIAATFSRERLINSLTALFNAPERLG